MKKLKKFIETENERLSNCQNLQDNQKQILAITVKIMEELGELCNEILAHNSLQRKEKLENHDKDKIQEELADVIITTLLLAKAMNIDVGKALEDKIEKINKRYE